MNPESQSWYYARDGEQHGPVSFLQLKNLVASGELVIEDLVWNESLEDWIPFREVTGEVAANELTSPSPTHPGGSVSRSRLPVPADLKRASFPKLMVLGAVTTAAIIGLVALIFYTLTLSIPGGPPVVSPSGHPFDRFAIPASILVGIVALGFLVWFVVVSMIYVHRAWRMLQPFGASITPGIAVGLQFIPIFNLYWYFRAYYNWSKEYNAICSSQPSLQLAPRTTEGMFLAYCITQVVSFAVDRLVPEDSSLAIASGMIGLVSVICFIMMFYQICNAINYFVEVRDRQIMEQQAGF